MKTPDRTIVARPTTDTIASCLGCGKSNYNGGMGAPITPNGVELTEIRIQGNPATHVTLLCPACLTALSRAIYPFRS